MSTWPPAQPALPAPGWYTDPADPQLQRWWTGAEWTNDVRSPTPPPPPPPPPPTPAQQYGAITYAQPAATEPSQYEPEVAAYRPMGSAYFQPDPVWTSDRSPNTLPIWLLVLLPLIAIALALAVFTFVPGVLNVDSSRFASVGMYVAALLLAVWDWSTLRRRGLHSAFFAWAFISGFVYIIARLVVLKSNGKRHKAPLFAYLATWVVVFVGVAVAVTLYFS
jgi:hypothetical protein